jgi:excinuclease ABC subunit C
VGEKRKQQLLKHFKTIGAIKEASIAELHQVVPENTAKAVYEYYHGGNKTEGASLCE